MHHFVNYLFVLYIVLFSIAHFAVKKAVGKKRYMPFFYFVSGGFLAYFLWAWNDSFNGVWNLHQQYSFGFFLSWLLFLAILSIFVFSETLLRIACIPFRWKKEERLPSRRRFVSLLGLGIASIPFAGMLYGIFKGRYNFRVIKHTLFFDDLPSEFDGYLITHISDIHSGSFDNIEKVTYGINLINEQKSDVIFFTGDLVNNSSQEIEKWKHIFSNLYAPDGVFSVLGNHDYGDYMQWNSLSEKEENLENLKNIQKEMGFSLLLNQHHFIKRKNQRLAILGVENWGKGFIQKGDLQQTLKGVSPSDFKILLSHDPTHWQYQVKNHTQKIQLTLSGHTHGMQFGIEIPGWIKWSPARFIYKYWGGMYQENQRFLNVNRGFGYLAFPGRVGMPPEITVIELKKQTNA